MSYYPIEDDVELGKFNASFEFADKEIRLGFVRKVFGKCAGQQGSSRAAAGQRVAAGGLLREGLGGRGGRS
jgi:hypothetical protein